MEQVNNMISSKVIILDKDPKIGAMVKALAFEVDGPKAVRGASGEFLESHGYLTFHFSSSTKMKEFEEAVNSYLPNLLAKVV